MKYAGGKLEKAYDSQGYDLFNAGKGKWLLPLIPRKFETNVHVEIPKEHVGQVSDRSSKGSQGIRVLGGIIDNDYRGTIQVTLVNLSWWPKKIVKGDKIAQLLILKCYDSGAIKVPREQLSETERGDRGFGSTG